MTKGCDNVGQCGKMIMLTIMNWCVMVTEGSSCGRIVVVSGVDLMKEVFSLKVTTYRPQFIFSTTMSMMITEGKTSESGESIGPTMT